MKTEHPRVKTYTKKDIVRHVAMTRRANVITAASWVDGVFAAIRDILLRADPELRIEIRDFGVLEVKTTRSKPKARNPKSGRIVYVPPRRKTHFKPSKLLKKFLSQPLNGDGSTSITKDPKPYGA